VIYTETPNPSPMRRVRRMSAHSPRRLSCSLRSGLDYRTHPFPLQVTGAGLDRSTDR
jgi:hypothetical protein